MMIASVAYSVFDVFTTTPFAGNPLAIVDLPPLPKLVSHSQKQLIAREFRFSETVFVHPHSTGSSNIAIDIFGVDHEIPFGGHPAIGAGLYLLSKNLSSPITLQTKAGQVPINEDNGIVTVEVPIDIKIHPAYPLPHLRTLQPELVDTDFAGPANSVPPIVSIVKGMTFILLELTSIEALKKLVPYPHPAPLPKGFLGEWDGMVGVYAYVVKPGTTEIRTRMFYGEAQEDAASGSAACALGAWWASHKPERQFVFEQGEEIGRRSDMEVRVKATPESGVTGVAIGGKAVEVMKGDIMVNL